jgi:hypothetical protein
MTQGTPEETAGHSAERPAPPDARKELEQEIVRTREQLGDTVEQLAAKADVPQRVRTRATEVATRARAVPTPAAAAAAAAPFLLAAGYVLLRRPRPQSAK